MKLKAAIHKHVTLVKNIKNWFEYYRFKNSTKEETLFITRKKGVKIPVNRYVMGVFKEIFMKNVYPESVINNIPDNLSVIDVGANIGYFPMWLCNIRKISALICIEPVPQNFNLLKKNMERNSRFFLTPPVLINKAMAPEGTGSLILNIPEETRPTVSASASKAIEPDVNLAQLKVDTVSLAQVMQENGLERLDILKMDCEGSEYGILYNASEIITRIRTIYLEVHNLDDKSENLNALKRYIDGHHFQTTVRLLNEDNFMLYAINKAFQV